MAEFTKPAGINFRSADMSAPKLVRILCRTVSFLQAISPYAKLQRYNDWWEHDGLHFPNAAIDFDSLFGIVNSPRSLLEAMPGDDYVFIGIAPDDNSWYLRFYLYWDHDGFNLLGRFDITLPNQLAERFRNEVASDVEFKIKEQDAEEYYRSLIL